MSIHYILQVPKLYNSAASYNRVRLFKKGFDEMSIKTKIHLLTIKNGSILDKFLFLITGCVKILTVLFGVRKDDIIIVYGETYFTFLYPLIRKRTHFVIERTEYPAFISNLNISPKGRENSYKNLKSLHLAEVIITCSRPLKDYYSRYVNNIIISPLVIDVNEISTIPSLNIEMPKQYVAYCGSLGDNKDGVPILIESFSLLSKDFPSLKLVLIGSGPQKELDIFKERIIELGIQEKVIFTGVLPHDVVIDWLRNACMLVLARPNNKQAEGGIPSKVGEYLATGVPCVITRVGDLPSFLRDGYDCFISEPDSVNSFAFKMKECLNADHSFVGNNAKRTVLQFSYNVQAPDLYKQLKSLLKL